MASRNLIAVRTYKADEASLAAYDRYNLVTSADVVLACDERNAPVDAGGRHRVGYDVARLGRMGLYAHRTCGWRCGDYQYYVLREDLPGYDYYWMVEPDVLINAADIDSFFAAFATDMSDFLASRYGPRDEQWDWHSRVAPHFPAVFGCIYPLTRLSGPAIDHLYRERRRLSGQGNAATQVAWPNDESFTATALSAAGFVCADLNAPDRIVSTTLSLRTGVAHDPSDMAALAPDGLVYHPVRQVVPILLDGERRLRVLAERARTAPQMRASFMSMVRTVETCLRNERHLGASLPVMLVGLQTIERLHEATPDSELAADRNLVRKSEKLVDLFKRRFAANGDDRCLATAHVAISEKGWDSPADATTKDFRLGAAYRLRKLPTGFALPYVFDFRRQKLLLTLHVWPELHLDAPSLHVAQRNFAATLVSVDWNDLEDIYGDPDSWARPIFLFAFDDTSVPQLDALLRAGRWRYFAVPSAPSQLAIREARLAGMDEFLRDQLIWSSIVPFLHAHLPGIAAGQCIIRLGAELAGFAPALAGVFPKARFVALMPEASGDEHWGGTVLRKLSEDGVDVVEMKQFTFLAGPNLTSKGSLLLSFKKEGLLPIDEAEQTPDQNWSPAVAG